MVKSPSSSSKSSSSHGATEAPEELPLATVPFLPLLLPALLPAAAEVALLLLPALQLAPLLEPAPEVPLLVLAVWSLLPFWPALPAAVLLPAALGVRAECTTGLAYMRPARTTHDDQQGPSCENLCSAAECDTQPASWTLGFRVDSCACS